MTSSNPLFDHQPLRQAMQRALHLASLGRGNVEPNPLVGAVVLDDHFQIVGEGYHQQFGGPHAEVHALAQAGANARGATLVVTLEPCCHTGKTPPCTQAILDAGVKRVIVAMADPFPKVAGGGLKILREAGLEVHVGLLQSRAEHLNRRFLMRIHHRRPFVWAKWAMTLDGKIATASGQSQWITSPDARQHGHHFRGLVDAIVVGRGTVEADNPQLTARPPGPRTPLRIVLDAHANIPPDSQLVQTARDIPTLIACRSASARLDHLQSRGCQVAVYADSTPTTMLPKLLDDLYERGFSNILIEGGPTILGSFLDAQLIDTVRVYIAPKVVGGLTAPGPLAGPGLPLLANALELEETSTLSLGPDLYFEGYRPIVWPSPSTPARHD